MANITGLGLDQSQIADAINRQNVGLSQKKRNEMMRTGSQSPDTFAMQNQPAIQQAQQPSEFWGAGRKLASNQSPDLAAMNLLGGQGAILGGDAYYYGDTDYSNAKFGTAGYITKDLGGGKYDILDQDGQSLGTGYKSANEAYRESTLDKLYSSIQSQDFGQSGDTPWSKFTSQYLTDNSPLGEGGQMSYNSRGDIEKALQGLLPTYGDNTLNAWEALGQSLNGTVLPRDTIGNLPLSHTNETMTGLNSLFGSTPLINDGKLLGYKMNLAPETNANNPLYTSLKGDYSAASLTRQYNNPQDWLNYGKFIDNSNFFVPTENASKLPGWNQLENSANWERDGGMLGGLFELIDPVLDFADPMHNQVQTWTTGESTTEGQSPMFESLAGPILSLFFPAAGAAVGAAQGVSTGNWQQALGSLAGYGLNSYFGAPTAGTDGTSSGIYGSGTSLGSVAADKAAQAFLTGTATNAILNGGDLEKAGLAGLGSAVGGYAGDTVGKLTQDYGQIASKALGGAASGALNSLFTGNSPVTGSLYGGMSGGLHGFLNSTAMNTDSFNKEIDRKNYQTAQTASKLAKTLFKGKK